MRIISYNVEYAILVEVPAIDLIILVMCNIHWYIEMSLYSEDIMIRYCMLVYWYFLLIQFCTI